MAGKKGMKQPSRSVSKAKRERLTNQWRENIQAGVLMQRLTDHHLGKLEKPLDPTQIKAAEVVLSRLVPTLSAVEQTNHDAVRSAEEIVNEIRALVQAKPELVSSLFPGKVLIDASSTLVAPQQMVPDAASCLETTATTPGSTEGSCAASAIQVSACSRTIQR